jgi:deazaflavin-dependent oxidoreductase (nitroreductase family)
MGIIQAFDYKVHSPNAAQVAMQHVAATQAGAWFFSQILDHMDKVLLRLSRGEVTVPGFLAGLPVLTVTTIGARTGQRRSAPLVGVPVGDDLALIGTSFGQSRTPGWYYNMRANPGVEATYRDKTVQAIAREADDEEWQAIWDRARALYVGYEAYARRIKNRKIHIMVLSTARDLGDAAKA